MNRAPSPFTQTNGPARYADFAELAAAGPVQKTVLFTGVPVWLVTGHAEVRHVLAHPDIAKQNRGGPHIDRIPAELNAAQNTHMLTTNPPDHTRLRRLVTAAFTRRRIDGLAPRIQEIADGLLEEMAKTAAAGGRVDLVADFAYPLPIEVICELLGVPSEYRKRFRAWSHIAVNGSAHPADTYIDNVRQLVDFVKDLVALKRANPSDDLLSALISVRDGGDRLSEDELTSMVKLLLVAGHETTASAIALGMNALLRHPEQLRSLRDEPERMRDAVEELLRYDSPLHVAIPAVTTAPVTVGGTTIPQGEVVVAVLSTANRDPSLFEDPARLDISRDNAAANLAFGHGIHHCLGAPLARLEVRLALTSLLARFPDLRLADAAGEPPREPALLVNTLTELPVLLLDG
ncbi:cytochrome P450 [Streptomyces sp. NPDC087420]|uniref:cytochrome P450 family protein n=1 Tax=Streptomyces sp. NPDC087420 TaxID=3365785 RepID=UPI0038342523